MTAYETFRAILEMEAGIPTDFAAEIVTTAETVEDFFAAHGRRLRRDGTRPAHPFELQRSCGAEYYCWNNVQAQGKGTKRGDLFLFDAGEVRYAFFQA